MDERKKRPSSEKKPRTSSSQRSRLNDKKSAGDEGSGVVKGNINKKSKKMAKNVRKGSAKTESRQSRKESPQVSSKTSKESTRSREQRNRCMYRHRLQSLRSSIAGHKRIRELSQPTKSALLTTWQRYCDVFDYERMRKVMERICMEFTLTTEERRMCREQMRRNATYLRDRIAMGSTEEIRRYHINTEDLQHLSMFVMNSTPVRSSKRTEELARPKSYKILATWNEYGNTLPTDMKTKFRRKYVDLARATERSKKPAPSFNESLMHFIRLHGKSMLVKRAAHKLVEQGIQSALIFAGQGRSPPIMTQALVKLSDSILAVLCNSKCIKLPPDNSPKDNAKLLMYIADWTAKLISDTYFKMEKKNFPKKARIKKHVIPTLDMDRNETIAEHIEKHEILTSHTTAISTQTRPKIWAVIEHQTQTEVHIETEAITQTEPDRFQDIPEIDNNFGNENDWDPESGSLRKEAKNLLRRLTIAESNTEVIHIRKSVRELKTSQNILELKSDTHMQIIESIGDQATNDYRETDESRSCDEIREGANADSGDI